MALEMRNSVEQRFLVRVCLHFTGAMVERKLENPIELHSDDFPRTVGLKRLRRHSCPEALL
jgi:hypothetical protein